MDGALRDGLSQYMRRLDLDDSLQHPLLFMWWVKQLQDWQQDMLYHPEWRRLRVFPVMERLKQLLDAMRPVGAR